jgi:hypothetical protein
LFVLPGGHPRCFFLAAAVLAVVEAWEEFMALGFFYSGRLWCQVEVKRRSLRLPFIRGVRH